jgi:O-antigen/teichoic acid export membrane protein/predicted O-methyltransferase YrrM
MSQARTLLRNVASNWAGYAVHVAVAFFLTPYVIHSLGETRYGIWSLVIGVVGYYGLLDLGVASGMTQYLTRYLAANDVDKLNRSASTGFIALSGIGFLVFVGSLIVALNASSLFRIQAASPMEVSLVLAITGSSVALQFVFFTYSAVFTAVQRFDLSNIIGISTRLLSAVATILCLDAGYGLVGLSLVVAGTNVIDYLIRWRVAGRLLPHMRISPKLVNLESLREVVSFGVWNSVSAGSVRLISYTDALVIAAFMPVAAVAPFAIAANLRSYFDDIFVRAGFVFFPAVTELDAQQNRVGLRQLYLTSSKFMFLGSIFFGSIAIFSAQDFFRLWVGSAYAEPAGYPSIASIFYILVAASMVAVAQRIGYQVLLGTRKVKLLALLFAAEGLSNLVISVALVRSYGLTGVAMGTLIPAVICQGLLQPIFVCHSLEITFRRYCVEVLLKPLLALLALAPLLLALDVLTHAHDWIGLLFNVLLTIATAGPLIFLIGLSKSERGLLLANLRVIRKILGKARDRLVIRIREYYFKRTLAQIACLPPGQLPSRQMLNRLWIGWGNESYSGHPEYLEEVVKRAAAATDPVLECGSGLTTILLGLFAGRRGIKVWTLEHDPEWHERIAASLGQFDIKGVELVLAPLRNYGEFFWYDPPMDSLPERFSMVVCDGPPQKTTLGDRYGLVPRMRDRLTAGSVILFDDVQIEGPDPILSQWLQEVRASFKLFSSGPSDSYAVVVVE